MKGESPNFRKVKYLTIESKWKWEEYGDPEQEILSVRACQKTKSLLFTLPGDPQLVSEMIRKWVS